MPVIISPFGFFFEVEYFVGCQGVFFAFTASFSGPTARCDQNIFSAYRLTASQLNFIRPGQNGAFLNDLNVNGTKVISIEPFQPVNIILACMTV